MKEPEEIQTERLTLGCYKTFDTKEIFECYAQDVEVTKYLTWRPHQNIDVTKAFVADRIAAWSYGNDFTWVIRLNNGQLIGGIALRIKEFRADFGYVIGKHHWGKGYATEALRAIVQWSFQQPQIFRVWAVCDVDNIASARVMEKAGLKKEGVLRKWIIHPQISNQPRDCLCYSITREINSQHQSSPDR